MKSILKALILLLLSNSFAGAQDFPEMPNPPRLVNDFAGILNQSQVKQLEQKLVNVDKSSSTQIAIVTVPSLQGYDVGGYAFKLAEEWKIGHEGKNNGVLILVKPKKGMEQGKAFIATGYGIEEYVPDAIANRIVDHEMIPAFKDGDYYTGLQQATNVLVSLTRGKFSPEEYYRQTGGGEASPIPFLVIIMFVVIFSIIGRARRARHYSVGHSVPFWVALTMMGASSGSHRGSFGSFSSGGGSFGGGGGFGGFGGGSFGGGGAGGSW